MRRYIKHWLWFVKESQSFMRGHNPVWVFCSSLLKAHGFAKSMCKWDMMTAEQREAWYLSGEGRTIVF